MKRPPPILVRGITQRMMQVVRDTPLKISATVVRATLSCFSVYLFASLLTVALFKITFDVSGFLEEIFIAILISVYASLQASNRAGQLHAFSLPLPIHSLLACSVYKLDTPYILYLKTNGQCMSVCLYVCLSVRWDTPHPLVASGSISSHMPFEYHTVWAYFTAETAKECWFGEILERQSHGGIFQ